MLVPRERNPRTFESIEEICNYLLGHKEVADRVRPRGPGKAVFLMFDEETEELARGLGLDVAFPPASLRHRLDSKIVTTELGNAAGIPSVPNALGRARTYDELLELAASAGLGTDLVVQTPYGDSGQTTHFVASRADWDQVAGDLAGVELKAMKRIDPREAAIEGVVTRHGTLVGPLMTELTGFPELTPYGGGWCGNDIHSQALTDRHRRQARLWTQAMGEQLRAEGYRGYFELDFVVDSATGEMYLGELNPRVTGASSMTNVNAVAYGDMPLFQPLSGRRSRHPRHSRSPANRRPRAHRPREDLDQRNQEPVRERADGRGRGSPSTRAVLLQAAVAMERIPFTFRALEEAFPGTVWQRFRESWPWYRQWYLQEGDEARPSYATCAQELATHMLELVPTWERLVELAGGGDLEARLLSLYRPPPYLAACSQGVLAGTSPVLARNYDYAPSRLEGVIWSTAWQSRQVIGMGDCLWGLLDGVNDAGLAVSLRLAAGPSSDRASACRWARATCSRCARPCRTRSRSSSGCPSTSPTTSRSSTVGARG